jgi:polar amino acid transport system substrate-binding protein
MALQDDGDSGGPVGRRGRALRRGLLRGTAAGMLAATALGARRAAAQGATQSRLYDVLKRGRLVVGTGSTNPPWHFEDDNANLVGFDVDMARIIAKGLFDDPAKIEFVRQAEAARVPNLLSDKVDVTIQFMTVTAGRAQQVEFSIPYYRSGVALLMQADSKYKIFADLRTAGAAITVSVLQNVYAEDLVHEALPEATVMQLDTQANVIQAVVSGRATAAATGKAQLRWFMVTQPGKFADVGFSWYPQTYGCAVRPGDAIWLNFINTCLHEAMVGIDYKSYRYSFKHYFGEDLPPVKVGAPSEYFG